MKNLIIICLVLVVASCTRKADKEAAERALKSKLSDDNLNGTFEYNQPIDKGFIHLVIKTNKRGDSLTGNFLGGIYLEKSEKGDYSNPNTLTECKLLGIIKKKKIIEVQMKVIKTENLKNDAPDFLGMMNLSKQISTVWIFTLDNGTLVSQNGMVEGGTLVKYTWKKIE